jgi:thymidine phosphorylase
MATIEEARGLAGYMAEVAARVGVPSVMLLTDLDSVLGASVGNAVAVQETVDFFLGRHRDGRVLELVLSVVAEMVALAGVERDPAAARRLAQARLEDGSATERFARMVKALGGPGDFVEKASAYLPATPVVRPVLSETAGFVSGMDASAVGHALVELGGGRKHPEGEIDLAVGFTAFAPVGAEVSRDRPLAIVHARNEGDLERAAQRIRSAVRLGPNPGAAAGSVVKERIARSV